MIAYTDTTVRRRPENTCRKKPMREKRRQKIWVGNMAQALNILSCKATKFKRIGPRTYRNEVLKQKENIEGQTRCRPRMTILHATNLLHGPP